MATMESNSPPTAGRDCAKPARITQDFSRETIMNAVRAVSRHANFAQIILISLFLLGCDFIGPPLPVKVMQRNAVLAGGKVAIFTNTGHKTLSVAVVLENSSFQQRQRFNVVLEPGETKEIGGFEGWRVLPGETVKLSCEGYASAGYTFVE